MDSGRPGYIEHGRIEIYVTPHERAPRGAARRLRHPSRTSRSVPPPIPVTVPSNTNPTMSICLREATSAPEIAKTSQDPRHQTPPLAHGTVGPRPTKIAAIALANKLARMAWAMMAKGERLSA